MIAIAEDCFLWYRLGSNDRFSKWILPDALNAAPEFDDIRRILDAGLGHRLDRVGPGCGIDSDPHVREAIGREHGGREAELRANLDLRTLVQRSGAITQS